MAKAQRIEHPLQPVFDGRSRVLVLGTMPSPASRTAGFYYGHPQNRFWKVLAQLMEDTLPETIEEKKDFLLRHHIAVWDVIASCTITGSSDASIRDVVPNPVEKLLKETQIGQIFVNGKTAERMYKRYLQDICGQEAVVLPSTSPANAAWRLPDLVSAWKKAVEQTVGIESLK